MTRTDSNSPGDRPGREGTNLRITVSQLRVGDLLLGSGATVTRAPTDFALPRHEAGPGKVALSVSYPGKPARETYWNRNTRIGVRRFS